MAVNYGELEVSTTLDGEVNGDIQEGAGEGTTNYNHLINKPSINDIELVGNKSLEDLGIATSLADLADDEEHRTVSDEEKTIWNNKSDFSGDYNDLQNKPDIPTKLSDLEEDSGHQTITIAERANWNQKADRNEVPDSLSDLDDDAYHRLVTDAEKVAWNAKSDFSGSYDDLTNKPDIPDELSDLEDMAINNPQDGQTVKYDSASGKWKNSDSTSGDAYKSIKVADTLIIANGEDTLELVAGTNVTLTPDPVTKKVTINSTGGGGTSTGDMLKAIYDTNNDGIVDSAETLKGLEASVSELNYVKGVTNNIQTQLNSKAETSAIPDDLADLNDDSTHRLVTDTEKSAWNAKSDFSGSYNDLTDKPTIPAAQVQSDWGQTNNQAVDFIKNKPTIPDDLADLNDDSTHRLVTDTEKTTWNNKSDFSGSYNDLTDKPTIPDAQIQSDWNQTDDTKKDFIKNKPSIPSGQIQSDWNQSDSAEVDYIKNKPQNLVQDASYVHTDNNFTSTLKDKLDGIANGAEVNVQSDWNQTTDTADDYIKNKPTLGTAAAKNSTNGIIENSTDLIESGAVYTGLNGKLDASLKGANSGLAELDANGKVPSSQLPSFVDDVVEGYYNSDTDRFYEESTYEHVITPVSGKSWVDVATNKSYRWTGSVYVRVDEGVQLGETSDTAYRGDRGKAAYDHSQDSGKVSSATAVGLYKVGVTAQGHISSLTAVEKSDITELGIPAQDTTYSKATASADGLMSKEDFSKLDGIESGAQVNAITGVKGDAETNYRTGNVNMTPANIGLGNVDNTSDATKKTNFTGSIASDNTGFVTGGDAYTALDGKVDKEDGKGLSSNDYTTEEKEELAEAVEQLSTDTTTVTGNPLTFNLASEQVAESCLINLNPIQDLHGYDKPWVGGAGYNIWDENLELGEIKSGTGEESPTNDYLRSTNYIPIQPNSAYYIYTPSSIRKWLYFYDSNKVYLGSETVIRGNTNIIFDSPQDAYYIRFCLAVADYGSSTYQNNVCINVSNPSVNGHYYPYTNLCPITGRTQVGIEGCGKNILQTYGRIESTEVNSGKWVVNADGTITVSGTPTGNSYPTNSARANVSGYTGTLHLSGLTDVTNVIYDYIYFANADASEIYYNITPSGSWSNDVNIIMSNYDLPSEVYLFVRPKRKTNNVAMSGTIKFQLEVGETATTYEPYTESNDITIQFGQTVHGGQIDVERGKLVIDKAHVDMGDLTWNHADTDTSGIRRMRGVGIENLIKKPTSSTSKANIISSLYATLTASQVYHMNVGVACDSDGSINVYDTNYNTTSSVSAFTTFVTGQDLVYTLATPIEVTLTPYQVTLLKNANYLSSTGDTITVTYRNGVVATLADLTSIPHKTSELFNDDYTVKDADYNTFTTAEKTKLSGISTDATKTQSSTTNGNIKIDGTETKVYDDSEIKTELSTDTTEIEGNPISFSTLTAQNASECIIDLDPIQDLHGYDKPWVGGAGKNKLPMVLADIKSINTLGTWSGNVYTYYDTAFTILTDTDDNVIGIKVTGTPTGTAVLRIIGNTINLPSGSYTMNGCPSGGDWSNKYALNFNYDSEAHVDVGSGTAITITSETVQTRVEVLIRNGFAIPTGGITFYPMIRLASVTDATFEPYTNYASITGRTEIGIEGCGKNLLPMVLANIKSENTDGTWNGNVYSQSGLTFEVKTDSTNNVIGILVKGTATTTVYFSCDSLFTLPNGSYIKSGCPSGGSGSTYFIGGSNSGNNDTGSGATFTSSGANTRFVIVINNGYAIATNGLLFQPMCRLASISDSSFAPYTPSNDLNIQFGQTVYGASLDVKRGVLTVNYELKTYSGQVSEGWETLLNNNFYIHRILRDVRYKTFNDNETSISNMFTNNHSSSNLSDSVYYVGNSFVAIAYNEITTNENWLTYLASNNLQVCYELATPTVIQLTPHEVNLLKGANYISTDGDKITIEYRTGEVATLGDVKEQIEEGKLHQYSTEEKVVAKWIDGRLIYEKTIRLGGMTLDQNWHPINTGISNLDFIISIIGIAFNDNDSEWYPINLQRPGGGAVMLLATKTQINYMNTYNDEISDSYVTMRYVKTS